MCTSFKPEHRPVHRIKCSPDVSQCLEIEFKLFASKIDHYVSKNYNGNKQHPCGSFYTILTWKALLVAAYFPVDLHLTPGLRETQANVINPTYWTYWNNTRWAMRRLQEDLQHQEVIGIGGVRCLFRHWSSSLQMCIHTLAKPAFITGNCRAKDGDKPVSATADAHS